MLLKFNAFAAAKEWSFKDPDTGYAYRASDRASLMRLIITYRAQNKLPAIEELSAILDNYLCNLPIHSGSCHPAPPLKRGLLAYVKGGIALVQNLWYNETVSQEVADARSAICKDCPLNQFPDKGAFVAWSDDIAVASVGSKRSLHHDELGNCVGCGCPLRAKVHFGGKITLTEKERTEMKTGSEGRCWQIKE